MKKNLQQLLDQYRHQANTIENTTQRAGKYTLAGSAVLAAMVAGPVELSGQTVCGNLGAPTRTAGSCIGGAGNLGVAYTNYCAKFDFDGDGVNELQIRYYNYNGLYPAASFYVDPLLGTDMWTVRIDPYLGDAFPAGAVAVNGNYSTHYSNKVFIVPLSTGSGFGFLAMDSRAYSFAQGNQAGAHPVTGQPICCWAYGETSMWGADTEITISDFTVTSDDVSDCGNISPVLPVEFSFFTAAASEKSIELAWSTASESANAGFEVERSADDGQSFQRLSFISGAGESREEKEYAYLDDSAQPGVDYTYRIKQIDFGGSFAYSQLVSAQISESGFQVSVFPNPATQGSVNLKLANTTDGPIDVEVYNSTGSLLVKQTHNVTAGSSVRSLNLDLSVGIYFIKVGHNDDVKYSKLVVE